VAANSAKPAIATSASERPALLITYLLFQGRSPTRVCSIESRTSHIEPLGPPEL
jgi:hypothetical protein